ncbi:MAG TPA: tripartite tricarboxylate transporter substrate-binding protein, partial [Burkholderiaceae bacterium]|nr:tripartite tricarboxylate transporter substrate-binding protein [Burkholderiaceae bacterium]
AITAVAAGDVQAFMVPLSVAVPQAANGRVNLLAITSAAREASAPQVPTMSEQGYPIVIGGWHVLAAPAGTPPQVVERLNRALNDVTSSQGVADALRKQGVQPATSTPAQAQALVSDEWQRWGAVARKAGVTAD